jgi:hypothetical protein
VWGREFGKYSSDPAVGDLVLWRIVHHLECIQTDE